MNISLTPKLEGFVTAKVCALRKLLREGEESGPPVPWNPEEIKIIARERVRKRR